MTHASDFPACLGIQAMTKIRVDSRNFYVAPAAAPLFYGFLTEVVAKGYSLDEGILDDWSYNCRNIRGSNSTSEHARGTAIDVNATTNPMGSTLRTDMPWWVPVVGKRWGLRWGGAYSNRKDAMHYEFMGTKADAAAIVKANLALPNDEPEDASDDDGITPRDQPDAIKFLQVCLTLAGFPTKVDGIYGTGTGQAVRNAKAFANAHRNPGAHEFSLSRENGWKAGPLFLRWLSQWLNFLKAQGALP